MKTMIKKKTRMSITLFADFISPTKVLLRFLWYRARQTRRLDKKSAVTWAENSRKSENNVWEIGVKNYRIDEKQDEQNRLDESLEIPDVLFPKWFEVVRAPVVHVHEKFPGEHEQNYRLNAHKGFELRGPGVVVVVLSGVVRLEDDEPHKNPGEPVQEILPLRVCLEFVAPHEKLVVVD
jgi:hypothetical protein